MRKIIIILLTIIACILIGLLCVSYGIKDAVINTLSTSVVKNEITSQIVSTVREYYPDVDYDTLAKVEQKIGNNEKINALTAKYFDGIINSVLNNTEVELPDTKEELLALINENEAVLKENGIEVSEAQKQKVVNEIVDGGVINKVYEKVTVTVKKNVTQQQKLVVKTYNFIASNTIKVILIISIIVIILLLALLKKSYYRWTLNLAVASVIAGVLIIFLVPQIANFVSDELANEFAGNTVSVNVTKIINAGYLSLITSALSLIIYFIGNKLTRYNESKYAE